VLKPTLEFAQSHEDKPATSHHVELVAYMLIEEIDSDTERSCGFLGNSKGESGKG
jgi:hypothetical protein